MVSEVVERHRDFLRTFAVFKDFHPNELLLLAENLIERKFDKEQVLFSEGDPGASAFFIVFGKIGVLKQLPSGKMEPLTILKSGQMFGQVALIDGNRRSATCVSVGRSLLLELTKEQFDRMFEKRESFAFKFQDYLTTVMVKQVRLANERLAELVKAAKRTTTEQLEEDMDVIYKGLKGAMKSAREMGIDLDDVRYEVLEGQRRQDLRERREEAREQAGLSNAQSKGEISKDALLPERKRITESIKKLSQAQAPGKHESKFIRLKGMDFDD